VKYFFIFFPIFFIFTTIFSSGIAFAHCPLCAAATGIAVTATRAMGVDDAIVGTFIGAFTISTGLWLHRALIKRNKGKPRIPFQGVIIALASLVATAATLEISGIAAVPEFFKILGTDRLIFGTLLGGAISLAAFYAHERMRRLNGRKNFIPLQGMILPLLAIIVLDIVMTVIGLFSR